MIELIELIFLGTGATKPTIHRFTSSIAIRFKGEVFLFDAGEGIQIRIAQSGFSVSKIDKIFVTHFHGDHVLGIPGIIYTLAKNNRKRELNIYGPEGLSEIIYHMRKSSYGRVPFKINIHELRAGDVIGGEEYKIKAFKVDHGERALGYLFKEKDRWNVDKEKMKKYGLKPHPKFKLLKEWKEVEIKGILLKPEEWLIKVEGGSVAYTGDTSFSRKVAEAVRGVKVLIHEATYLEKDKEDFELGHSSAKDAAEVAKLAGVDYLFLTHISQRYKDPSPLLNEAKEIFPNTYVARDLLKVVLKKGSVVIGDGN